MSYYRHHVFFCCNRRPPGEASCGNQRADELKDYAKDRITALGLRGKGRVRINKAGCLGRCDEGPTLVIYPDNVWYTYTDEHDIDEIIGEHLVHGRIVSRLRLEESSRDES